MSFLYAPSDALSVADPESNQIDVWKIAAEHRQFSEATFSSSITESPVVVRTSGNLAPLAVNVSLPNITATPGLVVVPITVDDLTGQGIISWDMQITFDPTVVTPASTAYDTAGTLSSSTFVTPNTSFSGHLILGGFQTSVFSGSGTLIYLRFNVVGSQGQSTGLTFQNYTDPNSGFHYGFRFNEECRHLP